ncbi:MAG: ribonuclease [Wenzhouxiangella sp.]|nr:ribonuclease [Wenzhouxiangella sp.]MCH8479587.1 ribonuclease [Wenzhouxiangella sp.]TVR98573.1 MAG: ribonuclease [Wenzhouxiangellaceae bacterium]
MSRIFWIGLVLFAALALWWQQGQINEYSSADMAPAADSALVVPSVEVRDLDGRVAWRGDVDLNPVLARISAGKSDPHRNDGSVFQNREGRLPARPRGHYREYVVRTPGIRHAGPQRVVIGADGEIYYTADHYRSFQRLR